MDDQIHDMIMKTSDMSEDFKKSIVDSMMLSYGPCYICGHKPIETACVVCHEMVCQTHVINWHNSNGEKLRCVNCKNKQWDGKIYTLGDILKKKELKKRK